MNELMLLLNFIFSDFFTFIGCIILISVFLSCLAAICFGLGSMIPKAFIINEHKHYYSEQKKNV